MAPKVIIAALIAFFPLVENTYMGLTSTPAPQLELFRALRASRLTTLLKLRVPHAVPAIFSGFRVALMLSLVTTVVFGETVTIGHSVDVLDIISICLLVSIIKSELLIFSRCLYLFTPPKPAFLIDEGIGSASKITL